MWGHLESKALNKDGKDVAFTPRALVCQRPVMLEVFEAPSILAKVKRVAKRNILHKG